MSLAVWAVIYFIITHLLICAWIRFDARQREINHDRWYKFCVFVPLFGAFFYGAAKRPWKLWALMFNFWVVVPGMFFLIRFIIGRIR